MHKRMLAEQQGAVVIELKPVLPLVTPDHLERGREAFTKAYKFTLDYFREMKGSKK